METDDKCAEEAGDCLVVEETMNRREEEMRAGRERGNAWVAAYSLGRRGGLDTARGMALLLGRDLLAGDPRGFQVLPGTPAEIAAQALRELARRLAPVEVTAVAEL
jgi:DNA-directed RNA polymerase beta' subunit